ncbi:MAG: carboxypeptidase-like regulatory domain-containing protein [Ferruginibacter sp.]
MAQEENIIYGAADFERYHSGKMSAQEMHALEKATLDDPFLSDALEGYVHTHTPLADISELNKRLQQKEDKNKIAWFRRSNTAPFLRIAAVLILFAGISWIWYHKNNPAKIELSDISLKDIPKKEIVPIPLGPADSITKEDYNFTTDKETGNRQKESKTTATIPAPVKDASPYAEDEPATLANSRKEIISSQVMIQRDSIAIAMDVKGTTQSTNLNNALQGKVAGIQVQSKATFQGKVKDTAGNPVSFATVVLNNKVGVVANAEGDFSIKSDQAQPVVAVSAPGYEDFKTQLNDSNNMIVLNKKEGLYEEVIVTSAFGVKRSARSTTAKKNSRQETTREIQRITVTNATPVGGWQQFNKYVADSMRTIQQINGEIAGAEIRMSFSVNEKGEPVNITIKRSSCQACDKEAIRIIQNGPAWQLNNKHKKAFAIARF